MNEDKIKLANDLIDFIHASPSAFHVVRNIKAALLKQGFQELNAGDDWKLKKETKYFVSKNDTAVIAFITGKGKLKESGFKIIASHTDSPGIKIKPNIGVQNSNGYTILNTEVYGGPILNTWFDRPLSIAGRVSLKSKDPLKPETRYLTVRKPICIIPNLAIHLNREINDGIKIERQKMLLPVLSIVKEQLEKKNYLYEVIASELKVDIEKILDFDVFLYDTNKGEIIGNDDEFISCGKLDNLAMVHTSIQALVDSEAGDATKVVVCFDNEEVGSLSKQGAGAPLLKNTLSRICLQLDKEPESLYRAIEHSFMISADMAHALHPAFTEKYDTINRPAMNAGPVIKINANQKYTTDGDSAAVYDMLCKNAEVPVQRYVNHSDIAGGSTLGGISSGQLDFRSVDIGNPMLAMHSIRELGGVDDHHYVLKSFEEFFK